MTSGRNALPCVHQTDRNCAGIDYRAIWRSRYGVRNLDGDVRLTYGA